MAMNKMSLFISFNFIKTLSRFGFNGPFVNFFQIYWAGPCLGGICAVLLYTQAFLAPTPRYNVSERYRTTADDKEMARLEGKRDLA